MGCSIHIICLVKPNLNMSKITIVCEKGGEVADKNSWVEYLRKISSKPYIQIACQLVNFTNQLL